jgi:hypothetical protein
MDKDTIRNIIFNGLGDSIGDGYDYKVIVVDDTYIPVEESFVRHAITTDQILSNDNYESDEFDCDDYVLYLRTKLSTYALNNKLGAPLALGFLITHRHAYNFFINTDDQLGIINTQSTDRKLTFDKNDFAAFLELDSDNSIQLLYI